MPGSSPGMTTDEWAAPDLARRAFEREERAEHDLLAVEIEAVLLREETHDVLPHLDPLIKTAARRQPAHAGELAAHDLALAAPLATARRRANHARQPLRQELAHRPIG